MSIQPSQGTGVSARVSWLAFATAKCKAIQLSIERRSFERKLETIVRAANAHHSCGGRQGQSSSNCSESAPMNCVHNFAQRWNISPELLEAQIPAIRKLKSLADPPPKPEPCSPGFSGSCWCGGSLLSDGSPRRPSKRWLSPDRRPLIMILELIVAAEASVLSASWIRRSRMRRQQILMGGSTSEINLPFLDQYLRQQTTNPTRLQTFAARETGCGLSPARFTPKHSNSWS